MSVIGVFSGGVATFAASDGAVVTSGIRKSACESSDIGVAGLPGDASHEPDHHTPDKTVHLFARRSYGLIEERLGRALPRPAFGENILTEGLDEDAVCVGDIWRIGGVALRVTQPTERCRTVGRSLAAPRMLRVLHELEICGFYAVVVEPGRVVKGAAIELCARPRPEWTIRRLHRAMFRRLGDKALMIEVITIPELSQEWKRRIAVMRDRRARGEPVSSNLADL